MFIDPGGFAPVVTLGQCNKLSAINKCLQPGSSMMNKSDKIENIKAGVYRHYKGPLYDVIGLARHSETGEQLVVYRPQYGERGLWVRPLTMFMENVDIDGRTVPRFEYTGA